MKQEDKELDEAAKKASDAVIHYMLTHTEPNPKRKAKEINTKKDKNLLIKDILPRLPYGVVVCCKEIFENENQWEECLETLVSINVQGSEWNNETFITEENEFSWNEFVVFLRPMSSMTEEEKKQYQILTPIVEVVFEDDASNLIDWLNSHYFDYRGLIKKGLALEAPEGMYKMK